MKLRDLLGKRVELLQDECWAGVPRGNFILAGAKGTVELAEMPGQSAPLVHIHFDRIKPREGFYFGIGTPDWEFSDARRGLLRIIEEEKER